ncbi:Coatomer/clathrin adaptor appendage, Ig-like subdomain-containing protein [Baffinella frigidus]|nr:Coatomer/clathrin adaptor appendage, Ig-like subdomain-containing protein [Cryptophyta sp. CCMP2293]
MAYSKNGITAKFDLVKHPSNAQLTQINITYLNGNASEVTNFMFQAAVPKHAKLQVTPATSGTLPPNNAAPVTQVLRVMKAPEAATKPLVMKLKIDYSIDGQPELGRC